MGAPVTGRPTSKEFSISSSSTGPRHRNWTSKLSIVSRRSTTSEVNLFSADVGNLLVELQRADVQLSSGGVSSVHAKNRKSDTSLVSNLTASHHSLHETLLNADNSIHGFSCEMNETSEQEQQQLTPEGQAQEYYVERFENSHIPDESSTYPRFTDGELKLGPILGKGGFGVVYEIKAIELMHDSFKSLRSAKSNSQRKSMVREADEDDDEDVDKEELLNRHFIRTHCLRHNPKNRGDARYAMKVLRPEVQQDSERRILGMVDMATELRVLSSTKHPNIVKLRAVASVSPFDPSFYLVLDRLYDTLEVRIAKWKKERKRCKGWKGKLLFDRDGQRRSELWDDRLIVTMDLAGALAHLHENGIIHRDLKPQNIGFDVRDDVKIFDFGLSKEFPKQNKEKEVYHFTQMAGSPRYMAEEVALGRPYNESCDTYSFALLVWQILALKQPYGKACSLDHLVGSVWNGPKERPAIDSSWSANLQGLLFEAWNSSWRARPSMTSIHKRLMDECMVMVDASGKGGASTGGSVEDQQSMLESRSNPVRRRSTFVFNTNSTTHRAFLASLGLGGSKRSSSSSTATRRSKGAKIP